MKKIVSGTDLKHNKLDAVKKLADPVASTLGPFGKNVILTNKNRTPHPTKDGVSIAKFIELADPVENSIAQLLKQSAESTLKVAGDGTTTTIILAREIIQYCLDKLPEHFSVPELKAGMDQTFESIKENLKALAKPIETIKDIEKVATISSNGDEVLAKLISTAYESIGKDGSISVLSGETADTRLILEEGYKFDSGFCANLFMTDERRGVARYEDVNVVVTDYNLTTFDQIKGICALIERDARPFVIIADNIEGQALSILVHHKSKGTMKVVACRAPKFGIDRSNALEDIAIATGATFISRISGKRLEHISIQEVGHASIFEASKVASLIVGGNAKKETLQNRIEQLKEELSRTTDIKECQKIQERISRLSGSVAIIKVGGLTPGEIAEKRDRIDDALEAVNVAIEEGYVAGGGVSLLKFFQNEPTLLAKKPSKEFAIGQDAILNACFAPLREMLKNAGQSTSRQTELLKIINRSEPNIGLDLRTGKEIDLIERGVIDPVKVIYSALENALSAAFLIISTDFVICEE